MAREGLRMLVMARRKMSEASHADFKRRYQESSIKLKDGTKR